MKKLIALLLCLCMSGVLFAGCGGDGDGDGDSSGKITITYMTWAAGGQKEVEKKVIEEFNKTHPNIQVKATFVPGDYLSRMQTLIAGHKEPDIALMYGNYIHDWAQKGLLADLTPYTKNSTVDFDDMLPMAKFYDQGKLYGATATLETILVYYNKQIFADHFDNADGLYDMVLDGTWTLDRMSQIAREVYIDLNNDGKTDENDQLGYATYLTMSSVDPFVYGTDIEFSRRTDDGQVELTMMHNDAVALAEKLVGFFWQAGSMSQFANAMENVNVFSRGKTMFLGNAMLATAEDLRDLD